MRLNKFEEHVILHYVDCMSSHQNLDNYYFINQKMIEIEPEEIKPIRLFTGEHLIKMGFVPGPFFKTILEEVEDLQLEGIIKTYEDAENFVKERYCVVEVDAKEKNAA